MGGEVIAPLDRGKWPASLHGRFSSVKSAPRSIVLLSPRAGVDDFEKTEMFSRAELEATNRNQSRYIDYAIRPHCATIQLRYTNFPKLLEPPQNSWRQKGDTKQIPH